MLFTTPLPAHGVFLWCPLACHVQIDAPTVARMIWGNHHAIPHRPAWRADNPVWIGRWMLHRHSQEHDTEQHRLHGLRV